MSKEELKPANLSRTLNFNTNDINKLYVESHTDMTWDDFHRRIMVILTKSYKDGMAVGYAEGMFSRKVTLKMPMYYVKGQKNNE